MRNKGFTLVELLGVIVLLGILGIVIIPKVGDSITNSKETALKTQEESIKKAAYDFLVDNTEFLEENDTITIKLGVLKQKGYLPVNIKNPKTRKNISNESLITVTKIGGTYKISLALIDLENVTENIDNNSPILVLNGDYVEYVEVNDLYEEKGAVAKTSTGETISTISKQIKLNNVEKSSIDTSQLQTYNIIYSVTDSNGLTTSATRTVIVRDTKSPTITFPTETTLLADQVNGYSLTQSVSVIDNYDSNSTLTVNSGLSNRPGKYVVTYTATDQSGNQTIERRVIKVESTPTYIIKGKTTPSNNNTPTMENRVTYHGLGRDNYIDVIVTDGNNQFNKTNYLKLDDYPDYYSTSYYSAKIQLKPNTTYKVTIKRYNNFDGKNNGYLLISDTPQINGMSWSSIAHATAPDRSLTNYLYTTSENGLLYIGYHSSMTQQKLDTIWANTDVEIEEFSTTRIDITGHDPLMCADNICDYIDYEKGKIVRYIKSYTFTGNELFQRNSWTVNDTEITKGTYWANPTVLGKYQSNKIQNSKGLCTHFPMLGSTAYNKDDKLRYGPQGTSNPPYLSFRIPIDTDMNEWTAEQYNAGTPLIAYYVLINPEYESINLPQVNLKWNSDTFVTDGYIIKEYN